MASQIFAVGDMWPLKWAWTTLPEGYATNTYCAQIAYTQTPSTAEIEVTISKLDGETIDGTAYAGILYGEAPMLETADLEAGRMFIYLRETDADGDTRTIDIETISVLNAPTPCEGGS